MENEEKSWLKRRWPVVILGGMVLVALLLSTFGEVGIISTLNLNAKEKQLIAENTKLREENEQLRQEVEQLRSNPSYIEEIARGELGLMGQKEYVIPVDRKKDAATHPAPSGGTGRP